MKNKRTKKVRTLKVYTKLIIPQFAKVSIMPEIRMTGNWLKDWGFNCGNEIKVVKTKIGLLVINKDDSVPTVVL